ncbi:MAG: BspA family leucine-rich repeat surface protein [Bacteroidetes bacterium]|nr:BspA family leucine-rich repeat surface protein [Bacteroidota bacterium]
MKHLKLIWQLFVVLLLFLTSQGIGQAQTSNTDFALRKTIVTNGGMMVVGNTLGHNAAASSIAPTVGTVGMAGANTNDAGIDTYWQSDPANNTATSNTTITTANAQSTVQLTIPTGATVVYAQLQWAASATASASPSCALAFNLEAPTPITADRYRTVVTPFNSYQAVADITEFIKTKQSGQYTFSAATLPTIVNLLNNTLFAAWSIVIVYKDCTLPLKLFKIYDGGEVIMPNGNNAFTVDGFTTTAASKAKAIIGAYNGTNSSANDGISINGTAYSDAINPSNNFFNSSYTKNGVAVSNTGDLPQYSGVANSMGKFDLDEINITPFLATGQTTLTAAVTASSEIILLGFMAFEIEAENLNTSNAQLAVCCTPATITTPPTAQSTTLGGNATFTVVATGSGNVTYQWQKSTNGGATYTNISGETNATLNLANVTLSQAGKYRVAVYNDGACETFSDGVLLSIAIPTDRFVTTWVNTTGSMTKLEFNAITTGDVNYTYTTNLGQSGSGTFNSAVINNGVTLTFGNTIAQNEVLTLVMEPANINRLSFSLFVLGSSLTRGHLTDVSQWGTAAWTSMERMFDNCQNLNISATDVPNLSGVSSMLGMFVSCKKLNGPTNIGTWNVSNITNMESMFSGATIFNQNISGWNVGNVTTMNSMFQSAAAFNQPISTWDVNKVTNTSRMFNSATAFNQPIGNWDVSEVNDMSIMFYNATAFNQTLGKWTLNASVNLSNVLFGSGMNCENYSKTLVGWANNPATPNSRNIGSTNGLQYGTDAASAVSTLTGKSWDFGGSGQQHTSSGTTCLPTPTLSSIPNQATCDGQTISNIAITLGVDLDAVLSASDDNTNLNPTYTFGGTGANRTLTIATVAGQVGATTVTVTATGSFGTTATRTFLLELGNKTLGYTAGTETNVILEENGISGLAIANDGNIYVGMASTINKIRQYNATGGLVNTDYISLTTPRVLRFGADGKLYAISGGQNVRKYNGQSLEQSIDFVSISSTDLVTNAAGDVFYVNTQGKPNGAVFKLPANFTQGPPKTDYTIIIDNLTSPVNLALSPDGSTLYVPISSENRVIKMNADGSNASDFILTTSPINVTFDKSGQLWLRHDGKLSWVGPNGELNTVINSGFSLGALRFDADGNIYGLRGSGSLQGVYKYTITKTTTYETCNAKPVFNPTTLANQMLCVSPTQVSLPNISITVTDPDGSIASTVVTSSNPSLIAATNAGTASAVQLSLTQQANQSGTATITIESTDNRGAKSSLQFEVRVNAIQLDNTTVTDVLCFGNSTGAITVTPTGGTAPYSYIWTKGGSPVGTDSPTITGQSAGVYNVTVTDKFGCSANRNLTINQPAAALTLAKESTNITCYGLNNGTASVTPSGGTGPYYYDWRDIGATPFSSNQSVTNRAPGYYTVRVSDAKGCNAEATFTLTQPAEIVISNNPTDAVVCQGTDAILTSGATGGTLTYQWYRLTIANGETVALTNGTSYQNVTTTTLTIRGSVADNGLYRYFMRASQSESCFKNSGQATVTVNPVPNSIATPPAQTVCSAGIIPPIILSSNISGTTYAWTRDNTDKVTGLSASGSGGTISGSLTNTTNAPVTVTFTITPTAPVSNCPGTPITATVTVDPVTVGGSIAGSATVCSGTNSTALTLSNQVGTIQKWQSSPTSDFAVVTDIANMTTGFTATNLTQTTYYRAVVQSGVCAPAFSATATVTVNPLPTATILGTTTVCQNATSPSITFTGAGGTAPYTFTYKIGDGAPQMVKTSSGNSVTVSVPTTTAGVFTYTLVSVSESSSTSCGQSQGGSAVVTVNPLPTATISGTTTVCLNSPSPSITFTGAGATAPYTFTYKINDGAPQTVTTSSGNSVTVTVPTSTAGVFTYSLVSVSEKSSTTCSQLQSGSAVVTIHTKPTITLTTLQQTLNEGNSQTFCDTDANPVNSLQFTVSGLCVSGSPVWRVQVGSGAWSTWSVTAPINQSSNNQVHRYQAACDSNCPVTYTSPIELTINYRSTVPQNVSLLVDGVTVAVGDSKDICNVEGNAIAFSATCGTDEVLLYSVDGGDYSSVVPTQLVDGQYHNYRVRCRKSDGTPSCIETESGVMRLRITSLSQVPVVSLNVTSGCGTPVTFSGTTNCGSLTAIWYNAATDAAISTLPSQTPSETTSYYARCQASGGCLSEKSNVVTFTIVPVNVAPVVNVSSELVCTGTEVTVSTNCPAGTSALWNTGVSESSFKVSFVNITKQGYSVRCVSPNGCQSAVSATKEVSWKSFEVTLINIGESKSGVKTNDRSAWASQFITRDGGPELEQSTQQNPTLYYVENVNKVAPRYWTVNVETCGLGTNGSLTFDMLATPETGLPRSFNTHENNAPYFMYANREGWTELYGQNHPAYGFYQDNGAGGNVYDAGLPKGLYKLGIRYWDMKGWGSIFPSTRKPQGNVLAYQEYWFRIQSKDGVGVGAARIADSDLSSRRDLNPNSFVAILPNPVTDILRLQVQDNKGQMVQTTLTDASGRSVLSRHFTPETNSHLEEFEVSELASGMYFLQVQAAGKQQVLKVVKVK